jgi:hypothetical protein
LKIDVKYNYLKENYQKVTPATFANFAILVFNYQYQHNFVYRAYCNFLGINPEAVTTLAQIPFLPISFFKTHNVVASTARPQVIFKSSGTTGANTSQHLVIDAALYTQSFLATFNQFYGHATNYCIVGLLPNYIQNGNSSLIYMVQHLVQQSNHPNSGFYLNNHTQLYQLLQQNEAAQQKTILFGVTFALLDFAEQHQLQLQHTTIIETGGMKGRRTELTRNQVHQALQQAFGRAPIHSEYGMTELLSQAYATDNGIFTTPNWLQIFLRPQDDPLQTLTQVTQPTNGLINLVDFANLNSCSFIATDDVATLYPNGSFAVLGRRDNSDIRGCSLMAV